MADLTELLEGTTPRSVRPPDIGHLVRRGAPSAAALAIAAVGDADVVVFLETGITEAQLVSLEDVLDDDPRIASFEYYDREAFLDEARRVFRDNAAMLERIDQSPPQGTSFRLMSPTPTTAPQPTPSPPTCDPTPASPTPSSPADLPSPWPVLGALEHRDEGPDLSQMRRPVDCQ